MLYQSPQTQGNMEAELLLHCAMPQVEKESAKRIELQLLRELDWDYMLKLAYRHRIVPLLYTRMNSVCPHSVPEKTMAELRNMYHVGARYSLLLTGELFRLLGLFQSHQIPAIPYKGPILASFAYGDLSLRQFGDLDLLVHERDIVRAKDILIEKGYQPQECRSSFGTASHKSHWEYRFLTEDGKAAIELQSVIRGRRYTCPFDFDELWARLQPIPFAGTTIHTLKPEDLFLILCVHGSKHSWERLQWVSDIAQLMRTCKSLDWQLITKQANQIGGKRILLIAVLLAHELLGAPLPDELIPKLEANPIVKSLTARIKRGLFPNPNSSSHEELEDFLFHFRSMERGRYRLSYCLHLLHHLLTPSQEEREILLLPKALSFLYYPMRSMRLLCKYGKILTERTFGAKNRA